MGKGMHTSYPKGSPLFIKLKNGNILTGKFCDHKSGKVILEDGTVLSLSEVNSMSIRKLKVEMKPKSSKRIVFRSDK